ncbi:hypothetical protein ACR6C2_29760 [Streptomyces sp. INA 01156]
MRGVLTDTESALRTAWLMACDRTERELRALIGAAVLAGTDLTEFEDVAALSRHHAHAIRTATGGAVGNPVAQERLPGPLARDAPVAASEIDDAGDCRFAGVCCPPEMPSSVPTRRS